mmetsp:Transcript_12373/g.34069  ORF Transcript_12373/g.34069 Transcript_12373/m.34069 type:complete len:95 (-) Transcript_12373:1084-1368(-)
MRVCNCANEGDQQWRTNKQIDKSMNAGITLAKQSLKQREIHSAPIRSKNSCLLWQNLAVTIDIIIMLAGPQVLLSFDGCVPRKCSHDIHSPRPP